MQLVKLLSSESLFRFCLAVAASILSGATSMGAFILLFRILNSTTHTQVQWWEFAVVCAGAIVSSGLSRILLGHISRKCIFQIRVRLIHQIVSAPLIDLERIGSPRLIACLAGDVGRVAAALPNFVFFCRNLSFVFACLLYLGWLSPQKLGTILPILAVGILVHFVLQREGLRHVRTSHQKWDDLLRTFRTLVNGIKELKLNTTRREQELSQFEAYAAELRHSAVNQSIFFGSAASGVQLLFFLALGLAIFDLDGGTTDRRLLISYSISIIYMMGRLRSVMDVFRNLREAEIALDRVQEIGLELHQASETDRSVGEQQHIGLSALSRQCLCLMGITHSYRSNHDGDEFVLGPVDLTVNSGEIVFVIGGNGSGKTTLAKIMTGLYVPQAGELRFNGLPITDANREWYSQHVSAIFSDFFLFERLLGPSDDTRNHRVSELLRRLKIEEKVEIQGGALSTVTALSLGERKRLALLFAFLEDRSIYLFDEWAADQDPEFKDVFYKEILLELRARGKMVVVISHDDRYFGIADKILRLERGVVPVLEQSTMAHAVLA